MEKEKSKIQNKIKDSYREKKQIIAKIQDENVRNKIIDKTIQEIKDHILLPTRTKEFFIRSFQNLKQQMMSKKVHTAQNNKAVEERECKQQLFQRLLKSKQEQTNLNKSKYKQQLFQRLLKPNTGTGFYYNNSLTNRNLLYGNNNSMMRYNNNFNQCNFNQYYAPIVKNRGIINNCPSICMNYNRNNINRF